MREESLSVEDRAEIKAMCIFWHAQWVRVEGVRYALPDWKREWV